MHCLQTFLFSCCLSVAFWFLSSLASATPAHKVSNNLLLEPNLDRFYISKVNIFNQIIGLSSTETADHNNFNNFCCCNLYWDGRVSDQILKSYGLSWNPLQWKYKDTPEGKKITKNNTGTALQVRKWHVIYIVNTVITVISFSHL